MFPSNNPTSKRFRLPRSPENLLGAYIIFGRFSNLRYIKQTDSLRNYELTFNYIEFNVFVTILLQFQTNLYFKLVLVLALRDF